MTPEPARYVADCQDCEFRRVGYGTTQTGPKGHANQLAGAHRSNNREEHTVEVRELEKELATDGGLDVEGRLEEAAKQIGIVREELKNEIDPDLVESLYELECKSRGIRVYLGFEDVDTEVDVGDVGSSMEWDGRWLYGIEQWQEPRTRYTCRDCGDSYIFAELDDRPTYCPTCGHHIDEEGAADRPVTDGGQRMKRTKEKRREHWLEAVSDVAHRYDLSFDEAEMFLADAEYSPPPHGPELVTDGGQPTTGDSSAWQGGNSVVGSLDSRLDDIEDRIEKRERVATDMVALVNDLRDRVEELEARLEEVDER